MKGLEISEISYRDVLATDKSGRLDSTFFMKDYVRLRKLAQTWEPFGKICRRIACGPFGSTILDTAYQDSGIPMIRPFNLRRLRADAGEIVYLSPTFAQESGLKLFPSGTLMFARVGDAGCGMTTFEQATISPNIIAAEVIAEKCNPSFAAIFFNTHFGMMQMTSAMKAVAQPTISTEIIRDARIPKVSRKIQDIIAECHHRSLRLEDESKFLYAQAEQTLLAELGLSNWQPPEPLTYTQQATNVFAAGRIDAEYFRPRYAAARQTIGKRFPVELVGKWGKVLKGNSVEYTDDGVGVPIVRSGDLTDIDRDDGYKIAVPDQDIFYLNRGDVCISSIGFGSIGKVQVFNRPGKFGTVSEVTVIRQNRVNPYFLQYFLRSRLGQMQIEQRITGATGQLHLYPKDVATIWIPIPPSEIQARFEELHAKAVSLKHESHALLARAKRAVELAIEQDEAAALEFLGEDSTPTNKNFRQELQSLKYADII